MIEKNVYLSKYLHQILYFLFGTRYGRVFTGTFVLLHLFDGIFPPDLKVPYSQTVESREGILMRAYLSSDQKWRLPLKSDLIPEKFERAILFKEDRYFYLHPGVNPAAVVRAIYRNALRNKRTSGASTLTMQVVRLMHPRKRTYFNKFLEILRAIQLEWHLDKQEILNLYANLLPYGGNIEGLRAASQLFFRTEVKNLSLAQITALTVIPNKPGSLNISKNPYPIVKSRNEWLKKMKESQLFSDTEIRAALDEPFEAGRKEMPFIAPHLCNRLAADYPDSLKISSSLHYTLQVRTEQALKSYIYSLEHTGIENASAIVIENKSRKIISYVGSADFWNREYQGQNDGVRAVRSPGSALKPFLYAYGYENGLITPAYKLLDVPADIDGFEPENYDRKFHGPVSAEQALAQSLNIPAVKLLQKVTLPTFRKLLVQSGGYGFESRYNREAGLSLILGGCGIRLEELTNMYATLASRGIFMPSSIILGSAPGAGKRVFSDEASYMVSKSLTQLERPDFPQSFEYSNNYFKVAWKTGTSQGRRDAWAIGYTSEYTVGIWVGNFDGTGNSALSGADIAVPLLFQIFGYLPVRTTFREPSGIARRNVCSETGLPVSELCDNKIYDLYLPKVNFLPVCSHMKYVSVSQNGQISYCVNCRPVNEFIEKAYPNFDPELTRFYESRHINYIKIPPHNPNCKWQTSSVQSLLIQSPKDGTAYHVLSESLSILLKAQTKNTSDKVYWFINKKFYKSAGADENIFFQPDTGRTEITCTDEKGTRAVSRIYCRYK